MIPKHTLTQKMFNMLLNLSTGCRFCLLHFGLVALWVGGRAANMDIHFSISTSSHFSPKTSLSRREGRACRAIRLRSDGDFICPRFHTMYCISSAVLRHGVQHGVRTLRDRSLCRAVVIDLYLLPLNGKSVAIQQRIGTGLDDPGRLILLPGSKIHSAHGLTV